MMDGHDFYVLQRSFNSAIRILLTMSSYGIVYVGVSSLIRIGILLLLGLVMLVYQDPSFIVGLDFNIIVCSRHMLLMRNIRDGIQMVDFVSIISLIGVLQVDNIWVFRKVLLSLL